MPTKLYIACDHAGFDLKEEIVKQYEEIIVDLGTNSCESVDYPDYAINLVKKLESDHKAKGILICGSGIGMTIAANRQRFIRAGLAFNPEIAKQMRLHNNANVLVLPGRFIDLQNALQCVEIFLKTDFEAGRHKRRINKLS